MTRSARLAVLSAALATACGGSPPPTDTTRISDDRAAPDDVTTGDTSAATTVRERKSDLGFADLEPATDDPLPATCRREMSRAELCPCLEADAGVPPDADQACTVDWFTDGAWSIAEQAADGFALYYLVHVDGDAYTPVATVQFLSPRGDIDESYSTMYVSARQVNGVHIVEVVGGVDTHDPEGPPDQGPPTRHVAVCRYGEAAAPQCATIDFGTEYTLRDDGTMEITGSEMGPEPGLYDLAY